MEQKLSVRSFLEIIAYSNLFYGLCIVFSIWETVVRLQLLPLDPLFYLFAFTGTVLFYNYPYFNNRLAVVDNPRAKWYIHHRKLALWNVYLCALLFLISGLYLGFDYHEAIFQWSFSRWILVLIFPFIGAWYYGTDSVLKIIQLRDIGWLKPLVIGLVWAGVSVIYPFVFSDVASASHTNFNGLTVMLFLKCTMYLTMLAILFDIKDMIADKTLNLKTVILRLGIEKTMSFIIIPLTLLGLIVFLSFAYFSSFSWLKTLLLAIPFITLIFVTKFFNKQRSLLFYLLVIDGLIIWKAMFGILAFGF